MTNRPPSFVALADLEREVGGFIPEASCSHPRNDFAIVGFGFIYCRLCGKHTG